jgi:hypothetical protein
MLVSCLAYSSRNDGEIFLRNLGWLSQYWILSQKRESWKAINFIMNLVLILLFPLRASFHCWKTLPNILSSDLYRSGLVHRRSQWPRGLRHEPSPPARTLGSWIQIPLEAWMFVCVYSMFVLFCVWVATLRRANPPSKESYRLCIG